MNSLIKDEKLIGIMSLVLAMLVWASSFVALKAAFEDMGEFTVIFFRMIIASLCFVFFIKSFLKFKITKKDLRSNIQL